ncbi:MAG: hypothetical protein Q9M75_07815, partial [Ghiorsea sp.]|nr:hypothetical protein [Ghiorsea sp.]
SYDKPKKKPVWMTQEAYDELPDEIKIREFSVNGTVYVTTLLDAKTYHKRGQSPFNAQDADFKGLPSVNYMAKM